MRSSSPGSNKAWLLLLGVLTLVVFVLITPPVQHFLHRDGLMGLALSEVRSLFSSRGSGTAAVAVEYPVQGIDVSYYQGHINWEKVKNHPTEFAFIRATQGKKLVDKRFARNWKDAKKAGVMRGAYHFFTPSLDAQAQANHFISQVKLESGDLPPVLDVERTEDRSADEIREGTRVWLEAVEKEYGITPILYTNYRFYQRYFEGHFDKYPIWIAHYTTKAPKISHRAGWLFWQHSETGRVKGISKQVDRNVYCGTLETLQGLCKP